MKDTEQTISKLADLYERQGLGTYPECWRIAADTIRTLERHDIPAICRRHGNFRLFWPECADLVNCGDKRMDDAVNPVWVTFDPINQHRYAIGARTIMNIADWPYEGEMCHD